MSDDGRSGVLAEHARCGHFFRAARRPCPLFFDPSRTETGAVRETAMWAKALAERRSTPADRSPATRAHIRRLLGRRCRVPAPPSSTVSRADAERRDGARPTACDERGSEAGDDGAPSTTRLPL